MKKCRGYEAVKYAMCYCSLLADDARHTAEELEHAEKLTKADRADLAKLIADVQYFAVEAARCLNVKGATFDADPELFERWEKRN